MEGKTLFGKTDLWLAIETHKAGRRLDFGWHHHFENHQNLRDVNIQAQSSRERCSTCNNLESLIFIMTHTHTQNPKPLHHTSCALLPSSLLTFLFRAVPFLPSGPPAMWSSQKWPGVTGTPTPTAVAQDYPSHPPASPSKWGRSKGWDDTGRSSASVKSKLDCRYIEIIKRWL